MENMDKRLTVSKWVLINRSKIPQCPKKLSDQIVCPSPKVWDFDEKRLHWASVVRDREQCKDDFKKGLATYEFEVINLIFTIRNLCLTIGAIHKRRRNILGGKGVLNFDVAR